MHSKRIREHTISKWAIRTSDQQLPPPRTVVLEIMSTNKQEEKSMLNYQSHQLMDRFQLRWLLIHASLILIKVATGSLRVTTTTQVQSRTWWTRTGIPILSMARVFLRLEGEMSRRLTKPILNGFNPFNDQLFLCFCAVN